MCWLQLLKDSKLQNHPGLPKIMLRTQEPSCNVMYCPCNQYNKPHVPSFRPLVLLARR